MTIKELCNKYERCKSCPFYDACEMLDCKSPKYFDEDEDKVVTRSIIDTAIILTESEC